MKNIISYSQFIKEEFNFNRTESNHDILSNEYQSTTIGRLMKYYNYNSIKEIDSCPILTYVLDNQEELNPHKTQDILFDLLGNEEIKQMIRTEKLHNIKNIIKKF